MRKPDDQPDARRRAPCRAPDQAAEESRRDLCDGGEGQKADGGERALRPMRGSRHSRAGSTRTIETRRTPITKLPGSMPRQEARAPQHDGA